MELSTVRTLIKVAEAHGIDLDTVSDEEFLAAGEELEKEAASLPPAPGLGQRAKQLLSRRLRSMGEKELQRQSKKGVAPMLASERAAAKGAYKPPNLEELGKQRLKRLAATRAAPAAVAAIPVAVGAKEVYDRSKKKQAFDEAVYERAAEHLASAGLIDSEGNVFPPSYSEKTAADVDAAALGLLEELGYPVEWY